MPIDHITTKGEHFEQTGVQTVVTYQYLNCEYWDFYRARSFKEQGKCPGCEDCAEFSEPVRTHTGRIYSLDQMLDGVKSLAFIGVYMLRGQSGRMLATATSLEAIKTYASAVHIRKAEIVLKTGIPVMVSIDDDNPVEFYEEKIVEDVHKAGKYYFRSVYGPEFLVAKVSQELVTTFE